MPTTFSPIDTSTPRVVNRRAAIVDLLRSEWTKIRSLRSTVWSLLLLVVVTVGFTASTVAQWDTTAPAQEAQVLADPGRIVLGAGFQLGQLAVCVLGYSS